jgi:hypothetical protein
VSDYQAACGEVQRALTGGGMTPPQAASLFSALEQFMEQFFEAKLAQVLAAVPQQPPRPAGPPK